MDFDDLLLQTNILFRDHPAVLREYRNSSGMYWWMSIKIRTLAQHLIVQRLCGETRPYLCVVGMPRASILSGGANIEYPAIQESLYRLPYLQAGTELPFHPEYRERCQ